MNSIKLLHITFILICLVSSLKGQDLYNRTYPIPLGIGRYEMLHEDDYAYYTIGYAATHIDEVGVQVVCHDKQTGDTCRSAYYEIPEWWLFTAGRTTVYDYPDRLLFALSGRGSVLLMAYLKSENRLILEDSINNTIPGGAYIQDLMKIGDTTIYHLTVTQEKGNVSALYVRFPDKRVKYVFIPNELPFIYTGGKIHRDSLGQFFVIGTTNNPSSFLTHLSITTFSPEFEIINQYKRVEPILSLTINDMLQVNDSISLIMCTQQALDKIEDTYGFEHWIYKINLRSKKTIWSKTYATMPSNSFVPGGKIVKGHKEGEYIYVTQGYAKGSTKDSNYITAQIVKINDNGQKIFLKEVHYTSQKISKNRPQSLIATRDGNYLMGGHIFTTFDIDAWLVKFDDNGNIIPIDTTSSSIDIPHQQTVSIYPNPATDILHIAISEVKIEEKYSIEIYGVEGRKLGTYTCDYDHKEIDISHFVNGVYAIKVLEGSEVIHNNKFVKIK